MAFNELAVSGLVSLVARESRFPPESCRMSLRLRRAGMEFYTSPIARGRGQMRIRTESSFLEPRFASIYAYGCRSLVSPPSYYPQHQHHHLDRLDSEPRRRRRRDLDNDDKLQSDNENDDETLQATFHDDNIQEEDRPGLIVSNSDSTAAMLDSLWRSRNDISREMEDVFLRSASQAITHYIEKQLHPAIKETLMLSMGYTISYG